MRAQCAVWPQGASPADFHAPLRRQRAGADAVGRVRSGDAAALRRGSASRRCPTAATWCVRGQGHNVIAVGCMPKLFAQFVDTRRCEGARRQMPGHACPTRCPSPVSTDGSRKRTRIEVTRMIVAEHLHKTFPGKSKDKAPVRRGRRRRLHRARRRDHRPARPQRRRQDHHAAHALHADAPGERARAGRRHRRRRAMPKRCAARWACCPMRAASTSA